MRHHRLLKAIQIDGKHVAAYVGRGFVYETMGRREEAIADYCAALALDPNAAEAKARLQHLGSKD